MRGNDSGRLLDQQQLRGKEGRGRNALRGECGGERGLLPGKRCWWRVWGAALDSWVRGDRSERCREEHLRQCGQGALWRRQRGQGRGRASGGRAAREGRGGGARESPAEAAQDPSSPWTAGKGSHLRRFPKLSFCLRLKSIGPPKFYHPDQGTFWE